MKKISELPEPYKSLAEKERSIASKQTAIPDSDFLGLAFAWYADPKTNLLDHDRFSFWRDVYNAETPEELPPIPEVS